MTTAAKPQLPIKESLFRGARAPAEAEEVSVSRTGGDNRAGLLSGVSLIAMGEARGHDMWIDSTTLDQVAEFAAHGKHGVKSRFTHPSMSADGMGRHLGRIKDVRVEGERVVGDLHFAKSAHETPDGNLAEYVMSLAEEDPAAAGLSIVFEHDFDATVAFMEEFDEGDGFESPEPLNKSNYPHVRLAKLRAADIVDEPAANPEGLFDRQDLPRTVDELLSYAAGLTEDKPQSVAFGVDADRATQFLGRWLESHGLSINPKTEAKPMSEVPAVAPAEPVAPQPTREEFLSELKRYTERFGAVNGAKWFEDGKSFSEALELQTESLQSRIEELETELSESKAKLEAVNLGEVEPIATGASDAAKPKKTFQSRIKVVGNPSDN